MLQPFFSVGLPHALFKKKNWEYNEFPFQGGFARCYELTDMKTKEIFAGKIVPKSLLLKPHQKEKMSQEICIHRSLKHKHLVSFHSYFEDPDNVYIILELCRRRVSIDEGGGSVVLYCYYDWEVQEYIGVMKSFEKF